MAIEIPERLDPIPEGELPAFGRGDDRPTAA